MARVLAISPTTVSNRMHKLSSILGIDYPEHKSGQLTMQLQIAHEIKKQGYIPKEKPLLTANQTELLRLSALGLTCQGIAHRKGNSYGTVKNTYQLIFQNLGVNDITQAVVKAINLGLVDLPDITETGQSQYNSLTGKERKILADITNLDNLPGNKAIARRLMISVHTVNHHLKSIFLKLGVQSRTQAAAFYLAANKPDSDKTTVISPL